MGPVILPSVDFRAWIADLAAELAIAATDPDVWRAVAVALAMGVISFAIGALVSRLLALGPPQQDSFGHTGLSLGVGLVLLSATWAMVRSGGSSAFTPIALLMLAAIAIASSRGRRPAEVRTEGRRSGLGIGRMTPRIVPAVAVGAAIIALGFMYGTTMTPSPRDGVQPVEFLDEAFYSVLGRDLATTGVESIYSPGGFSAAPGLSDRTWYHWGELWLAAIPIQFVGLDPLDARHYVALPLLLVAGACLTAGIVRTLADARGRFPAIFGVMTFLFLAPLPLLPTHFGSWPRGMVFGITMYGLAALIVLLVVYRFLAVPDRPRNVAQSIFDGALIGSLIPAHIVIAATTYVGLGAAYLLRSPVWGRIRRRLARPDITRPDIWVALSIIASVAWGLATGHGIGTSGLSTSVAPFNAAWAGAIIVVLVGGLPFLAIALALTRPKGRGEILLKGALIAVGVGAIIWGARLGDFTSFHAFYAPLAVLATPAAGVGLVLLWQDLRRRYKSLALVLVALCVLWLDIGVVTSILRLQEFGADRYPPIPTKILATIERLPRGAHVAYACQPLEELAVWNPRLVSIDAHTGHRVVPMCFQAEYFPSLTGVDVDGITMSPLFEHAPQRELFPDAFAMPTTAAIEEWMRRHDVGYIYADELHPNSLVPEARLIAESGPFRLLALP